MFAGIFYVSGLIEKGMRLLPLYIFLVDALAFLPIGGGFVALAAGCGRGSPDGRGGFEAGGGLCLGDAGYDALRAVAGGDCPGQAVGFAE